MVAHKGHASTRYRSIRAEPRARRIANHDGGACPGGPICSVRRNGERAGDSRPNRRRRRRATVSSGTQKKKKKKGPLLDDPLRTTGSDGRVENRCPSCSSGRCRRMAVTTSHRSARGPGRRPSKDVLDPGFLTTSVCAARSDTRSHEKPREPQSFTCLRRRPRRDACDRVIDARALRDTRSRKRGGSPQGWRCDRARRARCSGKEGASRFGARRAGRT